MKPDNPAAQTAAAPPKVWESLDEYMDSAAFRQAMADEFPEDAAEWTDPVSRRQFVTLMGAGLALAGAAGCSPRPAPVRKIVPYTRQPEQITPGVPLYFATSFPLGGFAHGVLVRSNEGRPTKVEGNPDHPASLGGADVFALASVLDLYDPDRSKVVTKQGNPSSYEEAVNAIRGRLNEQRAKRGGGVRVLTGTVAANTTLADQLEQLLKEFPDARWVQYDPCGHDNVREGTRRAFGRYLSVSYDFTKADRVVSLDSDFLAAGPAHVRYCRDFASRRKVRKDSRDGVKPEQLSRVYSVGSMPGSTSAVADHHLAMTCAQVEAFARALAAELGVAGAAAGGSLPEAARGWVGPIAADLRERKGRSVVVVGDHLPAHVHALAHAINSAVGAFGETILLTAPVEARPANQSAEFANLVAEMNKGVVDTLFILGCSNPAYSAPADIDFAAATKKVPFKVHLGGYADETAVLCDWHVPEAHYLECWGDGRAFDGTASIQQPLIAPLYAGRSAVEFVAAIRYTPTASAGGGNGAAAPVTEGRELVQAFWRRWFAAGKKEGEFDSAWMEWVRSGVIPGTAAAREEKAALAGNWSSEMPAAPTSPTGDDYEINFRPDPTLFDGRFANNGWLQELPKPVSKLCWDNAAFVSPATGKKLGIEKDFKYTGGEHGRAEVTIVELQYKGRSVKAPVWVLPGHPDNAVTVHLGHGRTRAGRVGNLEGQKNAEGKITRGFNAFALRTSDALGFSNGLKLGKAGGTYFLACQQGAGLTTGTKDPISGKPLERNPARRATVDHYKKDPEFAKVPPAAPGETDLIDKNVPGRSGGEPDPHSGVQGRTPAHPAHDHGHNGGGHDHEHAHEHDKRLVPLTMVNPNETLFPGLRPEQQRRWAMAIDIGACTGCNACVVACQGENNIPVVGKHEVTRGHEMLWIRVDRYYTGSPESPETHFQPVPCQQCEKAPCEIVCPVAATAHSSDGLNDMVYNRCVGTRYCSNNCPYKVRRFNFLTFQDWATESLKLGRNPDVSVRSRGVMEKCTYCVQRIRGAEIVAEREGRPIKDGEVKTACQAACPSGAIVFGDLSDKESVVGRWKAEPLNYGLLAELNTMPRTSYLAAVRNPNPAIK